MKQKLVCCALFAGGMLVQQGNASAAVINPVNDEKLAIVTVKYSNPAGYFLGKMPELILNTAVGGVRLDPNQTFRVLPNQAAHLLLRQNASIPSYSLAMTLPLVAGKTHVLEVPQLEFSWPRDAFNVEVGPIPRIEVRQPYSPPFAAINLDKAFLNSGDENYSALGVLPGSYEFQYSIVKPYQIASAGATNWGKSMAFRLSETDLPLRSTARFHTADKGTFPDAIIPNCQGSPVYVWAPSGGLSASVFKTHFNVPVKDAKSFHDVKYYDSPHGSSLSYFAHFGSIQIPLSVSAGKQTEIDVKRLDVNQVKVLREDQTEYLAPSTFHVLHKRESDRSWVNYELSYYDCTTRVSKFKAPAGLYLPSGDYVVKIRYETPEGAKEKVIEVTL
jgi:hypothetical protein